MCLLQRILQQSNRRLDVLKRVGLALQLCLFHLHWCNHPILRISEYSHLGMFTCFIFLQYLLTDFMPTCHVDLSLEAIRPDYSGAPLEAFARYIGALPVDSRYQDSSRSRVRWLVRSVDFMHGRRYLTDAPFSLHRSYGRRRHLHRHARQGRFAVSGA